MSGEIEITQNQLLAQSEKVDNTRLNQLVSDQTAVVAENAIAAREMGDLSSLPDHADDTAAGSAGVAVGQLYRTGSTLKVRVS